MTRVLIVAATPTLRAGLRALLHNANIELVGEAAALDVGNAVADLVVVTEPGLLAEYDPADDHGPRAFVVLGGDERVAALLRALPLAGWGIVAPDATAGELQAAVVAAGEGLIVMQPALLGRLPATPPQGILADSQPEPLTGREQEVLVLLSQGLPNKLIARQLQISEHTVKFHVSSIFAKLGAASRTDAVSRGARLGLITL
jgi:DNA-binding NarL/FixJ family response regulator